MLELLRAMSRRAEFATVILVAFGYFMLGSVLALLTPGAGALISESGLRSLIVYEAIATTALGAVGVMSIVPLGLLFAHWYARTGRLWPVVIAHAIFDFVGLWAYVGE